MYPARKLAELTAQKVAVRREIARGRAQCTAAATGVAMRLAWLDWTMANWRGISLLVEVACLARGLPGRGFAVRRRNAPASFVDWGRLAFRTLRVLGSAAKVRVGASRARTTDTPIS